MKTQSCKARGRVEEGHSLKIPKMKRKRKIFLKRLIKKIKIKKKLIKKITGLIFIQLIRKLILH